MVEIYLHGSFDISGTDMRFREIAGAKFAKPGKEYELDGTRVVVYTIQDEEAARVFGAHCLEQVVGVSGVHLVSEDVSNK